MIDANLVQPLIDAALHEDLREEGDVTSRYFVPESARGRGRIFAKEPAVVSGLEVAARVFKTLDAELHVSLDVKDGAKVQPGETVLTVEGSLRSILTGERTALNFLQRLSGIATLTSRYLAAMGDSPAKLLDTRKTTPGWRALEKAAVVHGGGTNHRIGLFDHVMVKDNHLLVPLPPGGMQAAIRRVKADHPQKRVQLEVDNLQQLEDFLQLEGVDCILLDNMSPPRLIQAVAMRDRLAPRLTLEASGGINLDTIGAVAATGVDFISCGALTHSARAIDYSLELTAVA